MNTFTLTEIENPGGSSSFRVYGMLDGAMVRKQFSPAKHGTHARELALSFKQDCERKAANLPALPLVTTRLDEQQTREAERAFALLTGQPYTLTDAVQYALANYRPASKVITTSNAVAQFIAEKVQQNLRPATLRNLRSRLAPLAKLDVPLSQVSSDTIKTFVFRSKVTPRTQHNDALVLSNFFNWATKNEYVNASPLAKIDAVTVDVETPEVFTLAESESLVLAAAEFKSGCMLPYITLGLFCAIRPTELERLAKYGAWDNVDFESGLVIIGANVAKMRGRRVVQIPPNALELLRNCRDAGLPFRSSNHAKDLLAVRKAAALKRWPSDVMRHTGISYRYALTGDESKTAQWAGNSPDVIHRHYKGLVKPSDVDRFWQIGLTVATVAQLPKHAAP